MNTPQQPELRIFISHSAEDNAAAVDLARTIETAHPRARVWEFGEHSGFGRDVWQDNILPALLDADVILLLCSNNTRASEGVARELGMVDSILRRNRGLRPAVVGVLLEPNAPLVVAMRDFYTRAPLGRAFDLTAVRNFDRHDHRSGRLSILIDMLKPRVRFFGAANNSVLPTEDPADIPDHALQCIQHLFPNDEERNEPDEIIRWLQTSFAHSPPQSRLVRKWRRPRTPSEYIGWNWAELLATLEVADKTIGVANLSINRKSGWIYGAYFGVIHAWRGYGRAKRFFEVLNEKAHSFAPARRGFVFEVAAINLDALVLAAAKITAFQPQAGVRHSARLPGVSLSTEEEEAIRRYLRLFTFGEYGARMLCTKGGQLFHYRQPAIKHPLNETNEVEQHLLVRMASLSQDKIDATEVLNFLFDNLYYDFHVRLPSTALERYGQYLEDLKSRTLRKLRDQNEGSTVVELVDPEVVIERRFRERARSLSVAARLSAIIAFRRDLKVPL